MCVFLYDYPNSRNYSIYLVMVQDTKLKSVDRSLKRHISIGLGKTFVKIEYTVWQNSTHYQAEAGEAFARQVI